MIPTTGLSTREWLAGLSRNRESDSMERNTLRRFLRRFGPLPEATG